MHLGQGRFAERAALQLRSGRRRSSCDSGDCTAPQLQLASLLRIHQTFKFGLVKTALKQDTLGPPFVSGA